MSPVVHTGPAPSRLTRPANEGAMQARLARLERRLEALEARQRDAHTGTALLPPWRAWVRRLAETIADLWDVPVDEVLRGPRTQIVTRPRFVLCWVLREVTDYSLPQIGRVVGYADHTSVIHALARVTAWRATEEGFADACDKLVIIARRLRAEGLVAPAPAAQP